MAGEVLDLNYAIKTLKEVLDYNLLRKDLRPKVGKAIEVMEKYVGNLCDQSFSLEIGEVIKKDNLSLNNKISYSAVAQRVVMKAQNRTAHKAIIKPKISLEPNELCNEFKSLVNPKDLHISFQKVVETKNGSLIIQTDREKDLNEIAQTIKGSRKISYHKINKMNPRVVVRNIEEEINLQNITDYITAQNDDIHLQKDKIRPVIILTTRKNSSRHAVLEVDAGTRELLLYNKISLGHQKVRIQDYFQIRRCTKCLKFHHRSKDCRGTIACSNCGGQHAASDCTSQEMKCIICQNYNKFTKSQKKRPTEHSVFDRNCPSYLTEIQKLASNTNYNIPLQ